MALQNLGTYNPRACVLAIDGRVITGFGVDAMLEFERNADELGELDVGVQGGAQWSVSADETIGVKVTLRATSPSYKDLAALAKAQYTATGPIVPVPFSFRDTISGDSVNASNTIFRTLPMPNKAKKATEVEFMIWLVNPQATYGTTLV